MASRPQTFRGIRSQIPIVNIQTGDGGAAAMRRVSGSFNSLANNLQGQLDREAVIRSKKEGAIAGATGVPNLRKDNTTLSGEAYNNAAISTFVTRLETEARGALTEIERENPSDPKAYQEKTAAYVTGVTSQINTIAPEVGPIFKSQISNLAKAGFNRVSNTFNAAFADKVKATNLQHQESLVRSYQDFVPDLLSNNIDASTRVMRQYNIDRARLVASLQSVRPDGKPVFSNVERVKQLQEFDDSIVFLTLKGAIDRADDKNLALDRLERGGMLVKFRSIDEKTGQSKVLSVDLNKTLSREGREKVRAYAIREANRQNRHIAAQEAQLARATKEQQEATDKDLTSLIGQKDDVGNDIHNPVTVEAMKDNLSPSAFKFHMKVAREGGVRVDSEQGVIASRTMIQDFRKSGNADAAREENRRLFVENLITAGTYQSNDKEIRSIIDDRDGPPSTYKLMNEQIEGLIGAYDGIDKAGTVRADLALIRTQFARFHEGFAKRTDPATGEPFGRTPTIEEAQAWFLSQVQTRLTEGVGPFISSRIENDLLGVSRPPMAINVPGVPKVRDTRGKLVPKVASIFARTPEGEFDYPQTSANIYNAFEGTSFTRDGQTIIYDRENRETYPDELRRLAVQAKRYKDAIDAYNEMKRRAGIE